MLSPVVKNRVASLLNDGVSQREVAKVIGVAPSTLHEQLQSPDMQALRINISSTKEESHKANLGNKAYRDEFGEALDDLYSLGENLAITRLNTLIPTMTDAGELRQTITTLNNTKRRGNGATQSASVLGSELTGALGLSGANITQNNISLVLRQGVMPSAPNSRVDAYNDVMEINGVKTEGGDEDTLDAFVAERLQLPTSQTNAIEDYNNE